ncbi:MAG: DNA mismatch repair endonuclease MutL, partial [Oscillospiraceae bacterium]|nr:DNA mismatch repair endonuclease MutL [Oscillospiraceae bacterium]
MGKINILEKQVAEMIAAGEVVERPSSIAKELLENAIDAGATAITAEIRGGGIQYLRITDNGYGIDREDVPRAFLRHATSKVRESGDLNHIMTMGFRGEALASIAAMCRVELLTRTAEEMAGTRCLMEGGEQISLEDTGCPVGTTMIVRDVFYNTPARMKFLKKDVTEGNSVQAVTEKAALAEPGIAFRFIRDGITKLQTTGDGEPLSAVRAIFGREFAQKVLPVRYSYGSLSLEGLICYPESARASRSMQNFFINRRFVHSRTCMAAIEEAYKGALMTSKFPACILYLTVPPQAVDVNVHPAKTEVRFASEKDIFSLVYYGCKTALGTVNLAPEIAIPEKRPNPFAASQSPVLPKQQQINEKKHIPFDKGTLHVNTQEYHRMVSASSNEKSSKPSRRFLDISTDSGDLILCSPSVYEEPEQIKNTVSSLAAPSEPFQEPIEPEPVSELVEQASQTSHTNEIPDCKENNLYDHARILGEIFSTYIILEGKDELIIVDKHAAHERLLFNKLMGQGIGEERQML